ncbi:unnamed protein product [Notodromas monacha]|uniref:Secreted protein n=1 Tax=Notodromas monacha TaxID=399045 RepID=A0A7R9GF10_9CRUS|nr:unnamed protein product [Notodromas monacha]CAG0918847.1 unnamed protein product [Notodromas monacha]
MCSMFLPEIASFVAAMLFAVHPIHTEARVQLRSVTGEGNGFVMPTCASLFFSFPSHLGDIRKAGGPVNGPEAAVLRRVKERRSSTATEWWLQ